MLFSYSWASRLAMLYASGGLSNKGLFHAMETESSMFSTLSDKCTLHPNKELTTQRKLNR